jgi:TolC family type I secretion outer membrane protein
MNKIITIILTIVFALPAAAWSEEPISPVKAQTTQPANVSPGPVKTVESMKSVKPVKADQPIPMSTQIKTEAPAASDTQIAKDEIVTLPKCIEIALRQQPSMLVSLYNMNASESRIGEARSALFPQASISGGYSRIKPLTPSIPPSIVSTSNSGYNQYTGTAAVTQLIYDFGKTPTQVNIAKLNFDASRSDLDATRALTILNVKQSYYGLLKAQRGLDVSKETVAQYVQHLDQAKAFFEVGVKPKYDVTKAEVDLSNARLNLITADNALKIARVTLNNAIGLPDAPNYVVEDNLDVIRKEMTMSQAIDTAMQTRPEVVATSKRVKASEESIYLAKTGFLPVISGNAAYNRASVVDQALYKQEGWNAGVSISIPIFSGFLTYHQVNEADANYKAAKANYDLLKQNVVLEVQQAYLNLLAAADRIPTSEIAQRQATENLEIAAGRYNAGVGNPIEVTDAQIIYTNAKTTYIQALYDYNVAVANLEKSMGVK